MKIDPKTMGFISTCIKEVGNCNDLMDFFKEFGFDDTNVYEDGSKSKWEYTIKRLTILNDTPAMEGVILKYLDPRRFIKSSISNLEIAQEFNEFICFDGYELYEDNKYIKVRALKNAANTNVKNIIFASIGEKPDIGFVDALENTIKIFSNEDKCLVYDKELPIDGLTCRDLLDWFIEKGGTTKKEKEGLADLYKRLCQSLSPTSPPEQIFIKGYYRKVNDLGLKLPALLPQVYLHYDPKTIAQLKGKKRFSYQRMDFLLLLKGGNRIVIEIDGEQHYSENGLPSPRKYAEMVSADRNLRLSGYEVYRFGGYEFVNETSALKMIDEFLNRLFKKYDVI